MTSDSSAYATAERPSETPLDRLREARNFCADRVPGWELDDLIEAVDDYLAASDHASTPPDSSDLGANS